jgi:cytochrome c biogenesis protein CcdA/glutaredoxin
MMALVPVRPMNPKALLFLLLLLPLAFPALQLVEYYGAGCPHCARVDASLSELSSSYNLSIIRKEVYYDSANRQEMFGAYVRFGLDPGKGGVPTILLDNRSLLVGEMSKERLAGIFDEHISDPSRSGIYTSDSFSGIEELDPASTLTPVVLVGAALADSVNPCTIAVMTLLLGTILRTGGKRKVLMAAGAFIGVVFVSYYLMGLGILRVIAEPSLTNAFFTLVTFAALVLAALELKAYFQYRPGFLSIEIPLFLRPYMKDVLAKATSIPGVAFAALICSLFLLPCSSGPYLIVLSILAKSITLQGLLYLFIYNLIFVLPMVVVALVIYAGKATTDQIGEFRETHIRMFHLIAGLIFLVLFLLLLGQMLGVV